MAVYRATTERGVEAYIEADSISEATKLLDAFGTRGDQPVVFESVELVSSLPVVRAPWKPPKGTRIADNPTNP